MRSVADTLSSRSPDELLRAYDPGNMRSRSNAAIRAELLVRTNAVAFLTSKLKLDVTQPDTAGAVRDRGSAARLLGDLGPRAVSAVPVLVERLEDEEDVRTAVTDALGSIGPAASSAIPVLIEELRFGNNTAPFALARIAPKSESACNALLESLQDFSADQTFRQSSTICNRSSD